MRSGYEVCQVNENHLNKKDLEFLDEPGTEGPRFIIKKITEDLAIFLVINMRDFLSRIFLPL